MLMQDMKLHPKQESILEILKRGEEGLSLRDIAEEIGVSSPNTVLHHLKQLEKGEIGIIVHNNEPKIKKIIHGGRKFVLESINSKYAPEIIEKGKDFRVVGKVKIVIHFTRFKNNKK